MSKAQHPYLDYPIPPWRVLSEQPPPLIYLRTLQPPKSMGEFFSAEHTFFDWGTEWIQRPG
jgi:hypothetical protein